MANFIKSLATYFVAYIEINLFYVILKHNLNSLQKKIEKNKYKPTFKKALTKISLVLVPN